MRTGIKPRYIIGTVCVTECFVTSIQTIFFYNYVNVSKCKDIIICLVVGGILAAPIGAALSKKIKEKIIILIVGLVTILINFISLMI